MVRRRAKLLSWKLLIIGCQSWRRMGPLASGPPVLSRIGNVIVVSTSGRVIGVPLVNVVVRKRLSCGRAAIGRVTLSQWSWRFMRGIRRVLLVILSPRRTRFRGTQSRPLILMFMRRQTLVMLRILVISNRRWKISGPKLKISLMMKTLNLLGPRQGLGLKFLSVRRKIRNRKLQLKSRGRKLLISRGKSGLSRLSVRGRLIILLLLDSKSSGRRRMRLLRPCLIHV